MLIICGSLNTAAAQYSTLDVPTQLRIGQIGYSDIQQRVGKLLIQAYQQIGIELEIISLPSKRSLSYSNSGMIDGELLRVNGTQDRYKNLISVPTALYQLTVSAYTINGQQTFDDINQVLRSPIAIHNGVMWEEKFVQSFPHNVSRVKGTTKKFKLLTLGRVDYVLSSRQRAKEVIAKHFKDQKIVEVIPSITQINLYHYLHKKHANLVPVIQAQLEKMSNEMTIPLAHQ